MKFSTYISQMTDYSFLSGKENKIERSKQKRCVIKLLLYIGPAIIGLGFLALYIVYITPLLPSYIRNAFHESHGDHVQGSNILNMKLICYYSVPNANTTLNQLKLQHINGSLCTHLNIGMSTINDSMIIINQKLDNVLNKSVPKLRSHYPNLKVLLWIGGGGEASQHFSDMIVTHARRKQFIRSLKIILFKYHLDGCDIDWEFPSAYSRERQHFSQLLYEIRQEYIREKRPYILSIAVAAPEGIAYFAYDVKWLNQYVDYVNVMSYDYHFYTKHTPFTGLNAPLYARKNEHSLLATLNINYSVNWWLSNGLAKDKLIVGLPTYGHSFTLVNPLNIGIGAPAQNYGSCGYLGFTSYAEICWFKQNNVHVVEHYDEETCSPYLNSGTEWISYEDPQSMKCKAEYIKDNQFGGAMLFSLNSDDYQGICQLKHNYPLIKVVANVLR